MPSASLPRSIRLTGPDGSGKTTQARRLVSCLAQRGLATRVVTVWDVFDQARLGSLPFRNKAEIDRFLAGLTPNGRAHFLHFALCEALQRARRDREGALLLLVGDWPKYHATELAYGADAGLLSALAAASPAPEVTICLTVPPAAAARRKAAVSRYESGGRGAAGFEAFQTRAAEAWKAWAQAEGWLMVDGAGTPDAVETVILGCLEPWLQAWSRPCT